MHSRRSILIDGIRVKGCMETPDIVVTFLTQMVSRFFDHRYIASAKDVYMVLTERARKRWTQRENVAFAYIDTKFDRERTCSA